MNCADSGGVHERLRAFLLSGALSDLRAFCYCHFTVVSYLVNATFVLKLSSQMPVARGPLTMTGSRFFARHTCSSRSCHDTPVKTRMS